MKALLLAAGLGTRLRPITNEIPKCLVPIHGKPLLEYWLDALFEVGITEVLINTHYLHKQVENFVEQSVHSHKIKIVYEVELLNTGGTILANKTFFENESFMVIHADNLCFADLKAFISRHQESSNHLMTMMTFLTDNPSSCGIIELDNDGFLLKFHEKVQNPPSNLANAAVYLFKPEIFNILKAFNKKNIDLSIEVIPKLKGKIITFENRGYLRDIGNLESYALAQVEVLKYL